MSLFVDSSAFYALADSTDRHHKRANELLGGHYRLVTSDHVLVESWRLIRDHGGFSKAERFWLEIRAGVATVESIVASDLDAAWRIGEAFSGQDFSIVDRTSFAAMERLGINRVVTFDDHFSIYRYGSRRDRAFEVLR